MARGYAIEDREYQPTTRGLAAPVFSETGETVAAISVVGLVEEVPADRYGEISDAVMRTATALSADLRIVNRPTTTVPPGRYRGRMANRQRAERLLHPLPVGLWLDFRSSPGRLPGPEDYREHVELVRHAEAEGFAFVMVSEHHASIDGYMPTPHMALAALAASTRRVMLGAGVALAPLWPVRVLAEELSVLDLISGGRALAGLGLGYAGSDYASMGGWWPTRGRDLETRLRQLLAGWAGEPLDDGFPVSPRPVDGGPAIVLGGFAPKALERAARWADVHFAAVRAGHAWREAERYRPALLRIARELGQEPPLQLVGTHVWVLEDDAQWADELGPALAYQRDAYVAIFDRNDGRTAPRLPPREHFIVGNVDEVARDLVELLERSADGVCIWGRPPGVSHASAMRNVSRIAREVLPQVLVAQALTR